MLLEDWKSPQLQMRANNNKEVNSVKKTDKPVINIRGDNNNVEVNVTTTTSSSAPAAITIALGVILAAALLAVSYCCPEEFADCVRWIISVTSGS